MSVDEPQTDPQATDNFWLGGGPQLFNPEAKAKEASGADGPLVLTKGGMRESDGSGTANRDTKSKEANNLGEKPSFDTTYSTTPFHTEKGVDSKGVPYSSVIKYNTMTIVEDNKDTIVNKRLHAGSMPVKKN